MIDIFYKMIIPIIVEVINSVRIYKEWIYAKSINVGIMCDTVLFDSVFLIKRFCFLKYTVN